MAAMTPEAVAGDEHCAQSGMKQDTGSHGKCSHCASCCVGAAVLPTVPVAPMPATFSSIVRSAAEPAMTTHIPTTPERPPRRLT
jgi:hypothetical protein